MMIDRKKPSIPGALDRYEAFCPVCGMRITGSRLGYTEREYATHLAWHEHKQSTLGGELLVLATARTVIEVI